jgi:hypothetical protein
MTVLPALSRELAQAGDRIARRSVTRRRQARIGSLLAVSALSVGGVAAAATGLWNPQLGDAHRGQPTASASQPPADQLADFAVLRRAASSADEGAQSQYALKLLDPSFHGVRTAYVRLVGTETGGGGYVLIPVESYTPPDGTSATDALCLFARDPLDGGGLSCSPRSPSASTTTSTTPRSPTVRAGTLRTRSVDRRPLRGSTPTDRSSRRAARRVWARPAFLRNAVPRQASARGQARRSHQVGCV